MLSVLPICQKHVQKGSQLVQNCLEQNYFVFYSSFKNKFIHLRMNKCRGREVQEGVLDETEDPCHHVS